MLMSDHPRPMTSRTNAKGPIRNAHTPGPSAPSSGSTYSPSVPISLYRQVANELQGAQSLLESLKTENQQLTEQNQRLQLEIERVVQSALHLREIAGSHQPLTPIEPDATSSLEIHFKSPPTPEPEPLPRTKPPKEHPPEPAAFPEQLLTGQESQLRRSTSPEKAGEIGGWWLVLVIFVIVVITFGTGFFIVRLLPSR